MKKILNFLIYLTIFSLPLYVMRFEIISIPMTFLEIMIFVTFGFWAVGKIINRREGGIGQYRLQIKRELILLIGIFLLAAIISLFVAPDKRVALGIFKAYLLEPVLFFIVIIDSVKNESQKKGIFVSFVATGIFMSLVALYQKFTGIDSFAPNEIVQGRVTGFFNSGNALCLFLAPITILVFAKILNLYKTEGAIGQSRLLKEKKKGDLSKTDKLQVFALTFILILFLSVIFLTQSSGGMLGVIGAVGCISIREFLISNFKFPACAGRLNNFKFLNLQKIAWLGVVVYLAVQIILFSMIGNWTPKIAERPLARVYENTTVVRLCLWEGTWKMLQNNIFFGAGLSGFPAKYSQYLTCDPELFQYPHNLFLTFWSELGIFGVIWLFGCLVVWAKNVISGESKTSKYWQVGLLGLLIYYMIHGLVDVPYFKNDLSVMWWIFLAMSFITSQKSQPKAGQPLAEKVKKKNLQFWNFMDQKSPFSLVLFHFRFRQ